MTARPRDEQPSQDLYQLLGLDPGASAVEIGRAYRRLARRHHPDVDATAGAAQRFLEVTRAYRVLSDARARARYDAGRGLRGSRPHTVPQRAAWPPWAAARARPATSPADTVWLGGPSLSRAFHLGTDQPTRASQVEEAELELTLEESCLGTTRTVTVTSQHGSESIHVTIPPGVMDGDRIEVRTTDLANGADAPPVVLRARLRAPEGCQINGRDLHVRVPVSPWEATLGGTITFDGPAGPVTLDVPAGTCSGHVLTLPAHGIPNPTGAAGSLYVHAEIVVPARLTAVERDLFHRLANASTFNPRTAAAPTPVIDSNL